MTRSCGCRQKIAYSDRSILRIHLTEDLAHQRHGKPVVLRILFVQYDSWLVRAGTGYNTGHLPVICGPTLLQSAIVINDDNVAWFDFSNIYAIKMFGAIGTGEEEIAVDNDISKKLPGKRIIHGDAPNATECNDSGGAIIPGVGDETGSDIARAEDASFRGVATYSSFLQARIAVKTGNAGIPVRCAENTWTRAVALTKDTGSYSIRVKCNSSYTSDPLDRIRFTIHACA